ncbi:MAG: hypothetical protein M0T85_11045, partial [Dehalococcoidales bacterium]|nr:hypothetical protein [Dehalococcoidales bacterium]
SKKTMASPRFAGMPASSAPRDLPGGRAVAPLDVKSFAGYGTGHAQGKACGYKMCAKARETM